MKNKGLSIIVIFCTIVSVTIICNTDRVIAKYYSFKNYIYNENNKKTPISKNGGSKKQSNSKVIKSKKAKIVKPDKILNDKKGTDKVQSDKVSDIKKRYFKERESNICSGDQLGKEADKRNEEISIDKGSGTEDKYPESTMVFKVNIASIEKKMSFSDKVKILAVSRKLSTKDYKKVYDYLQDKDAVRAILNAFSYLKAKLPEKDYKEVKKIASKFIDVDYIEKYNQETNNLK